jgi:5-methylcytosine-specific restriction endonuclease McrA
VTFQPKRRKPMRQKSEKRRVEEQAYEAAKLIVIDRDGRVCAARDLVPEVRCQGTLECHHRAYRSRAPGLYADPANLMLLCWAHHEWVTDEVDTEKAHALGLAVHSWDATSG